MADLTLDLRYAWRRLAASPSFAFIAIATLAAGIGVTTAVYSLLYAMMFRPINIPNIDRVVNLYSNARSARFSWLDYQDLKTAQTVFSDVTVWTRIRGPLTGGAPAEMIVGEAVEGNYFDLLGVTTALGRPIVRADDEPAAPPVAVLGHHLWRRLYAADPGVVGRVVKLSGQAFEVIGVAAPSFRGVDMPRISPTDLWVPLSHSARLSPQLRPVDFENRTDRRLNVKGRLAAERTIEAAQAEVTGIANQLDQAFPEPTRSRRPGGARAEWRVAPASSMHMFENMDRIAVPISNGVMAALAMVLLIACVNVANLLLARGAGRRVEMATRIAIGASRTRLLRQLLTENALLCVLGGSLGLFVAFVLTRVMTMQGNVGRGFTFAFEPGIEWPVLLVSIGATAFAGLVFGLAPAFQGARIDVRAAMAGAVTSRRRRISVRRALVVLQLSVSVAFLVVGGMFLRGFARYATHDPGFDVSQVATAGFEVDYRWGDDDDAARRFLIRLRDRASGQPGVSAAAVISGFPVGGGYLRNAYVGTEQSPPPADGVPVIAAPMLIATPEALGVLGMRVARGRFFTHQDMAASAPIVVASEHVARRVFGTDDVVGRRMRLTPQRRAGSPAPDSVIATIVGVTPDTDVGVLGDRDRGVLFVPFAQRTEREMTVAVRTTGNPDGAAAALSVLAREIDAEVVTYVNTGPDILAADVIPTRVGAAVAGGLGAFAFLLAVVGLYGVMSHAVAMRTREIGIRMALGAEARRVVRFVLREGVGLVIAGAVAGALLAYWIGGFLRRFIFGLDQQQPLVLAAVTLALGLVALVACWVPARRAARVDPNVALRHL